MDTQLAFGELFKVLAKADLFAKGPELQVNLRSEKSVSGFVNAGTPKLPGLYQDTYISPLLRNLKCVLKRDPVMVESLAGAVYDHAPGSKVTPCLSAFLAVISNVYDSFLNPEPTARMSVPRPQPQAMIPPLATFKPKVDMQNRLFTPFTLPADHVKLLCGGEIGVVSLPSSYRHHPALCWASIAHEAGGHDVLHAYGLLSELEHGVRRLFYPGPDPATDIPESKDQFLGLLWQYWTEETASDICAVMNLGPSYGKSVAVYLAALDERISRYYQEKERADLRKQLKNVHDRKQKEALARQIQELEKNIKFRKNRPLLSVSWPPRKNIPQVDSQVDSHSTDILKLNAIIGAIECLPLSEGTKKKYICEIEECIALSLKLDRQLGNKNERVEIKGHFNFKPGRRIHVDKRFAIERTVMEDHARHVGRYIVTEPLRALNGNSIQDLETWDYSDEAVADHIRKELTSKVGTPPSVCQMGDDAHLLAGALLALFDRPDLYQDINDRLEEALHESFSGDPIWGGYRV